ncbi:MAG: T9SS type A sorting domain-containing protein, partial [Cytophagales bacterium]|nr:T9SS type A sorting domain-containing protein [Cytophagales bacterium]
LTFGTTDASPYFGYMVRYEKTWRSGLTLCRVDENPFYPTILSRSTATVLNSFVQYTFRIERYPSGLIKVFLNDGNGYGTEPVLQAVDKTYPALGKFGWWVTTESSPYNFYVDWIEALDLDQPAAGLLSNVRVSSNKTYPVGKIAPGSRLYTDRAYTFVKTPEYLNGAAYIQTANDDKKWSDPAFLSFDVTEPAGLFVLYDPRATRLPAWLNGWTKLPDQVTTTDSGTRVLNVYAKAYLPGRVTLGGNKAAPAEGALTNYLVAAVPAPKEAFFEAEKASLKGAVAATNHAGYAGTGFVDYLNPSGDAITWQVYAPLAGQYSLSFRYALQSGSRPMGLTVNAVAANAAVPFLATGAWNTWQLSTGSAPLKAGLNTVTLYATGASGPNLDYLLVLPQQVALPAGRVLTVGNAASPETAPLTSFPNPTAGLTTLRYRLAEAAPVSLSLFDARGQRVATLVDHEQQSAGVHEQSFDARRMQSGLYFCRLRTGTTERVIKVIVNR